MWYWRQKTFENLLRVAEAARTVNGYEYYAQYCTFQEQGLRKQAFQALHLFIANAQNWSFEEQCRFVDWIHTITLRSSSSLALTPHPLQTQFIEPTLEEWIKREPQNPIPFRWKRTKESLRYAVSLSTDEQIARSFLIQSISQGLHFAVHELPFGYCGNITEDTQELREVKHLLREIEDDEIRRDFLEELETVEPLIASYSEYVISNSSLPFQEWAQLYNKPKSLWELE